MTTTETLPSSNSTASVWLESLRNTFIASKGVQILSAVLALQLTIALGLLLKSNSQADFAAAVQLVSVDPATVDEIVIDDGDGGVVLTNFDDQWRMNDEHRTLAESNKIKQLISDLTDINPGLPVASTTASHQQLEVSETDFQRSIRLKKGDETVAHLYMGTSPGFRKSHIRHADQDQVYAAKLSTFTVPALKDDWLDKTLLAFENVGGIQSDALELAFANEQWTIVNPQDKAATHELDEAGIASLESLLKSLRVNGFAVPLEADKPVESLSASEDADQPEAEEILSHSLIVVQNDTPVTLLLKRKGSNATVERSDINGVFTLPIATYDELSAEMFQQLLVEKSGDIPAETEQPQG